MVSNPTEATTVLTEKTPHIITIAASEKPKDIKLRVAVYARVSTLSEDQKNSFEAQIVYYSTLISSKENWVLVDVYADEGITGTSARKRPEFLRMIQQCRQKKIDIILSKSISRFARNTVDCLDYIRVLKSLGIAIIFEKENINTLKMDSELLITMMSSFAQAEKSGR